MMSQQFKLQRHELEITRKGLIQAAEILSIVRDRGESRNNMLPWQREIESIRERILTQNYETGVQQSLDWTNVPAEKSSKYRKYLFSHNSIHVQGVFGQISIWSRIVGDKDTNQEGSVIESLSERQIFESDTRIVIHPSSLVARYVTNRGVSIVIQKTQRSTINIQLSTFCAIPDNALIFEFSRTGNIEGIQALFSRGEASVFDTNTDGFTPLHVSRPKMVFCAVNSSAQFAAYYGHPEVVKLLLQEGASEDAATYRCEGPLSHNQRR
jgi:hypothetical protein